MSPGRSSPALQPKLAGSSAEYHFQQGAILAADGELSLAAAELEKALSLDKDHNGALFELAYINDLFGNDDTAVDLYKRCTERPPVPLAAWINLGVLYEDEMRFREAEQCYRQVLAHDPNHPRARLFVKDCQASKGMYYDEEAERGYTVLKQLLEIPVTDFELSVRSRNCLRKMNIRTLGDLTRTTETALLASKNFGETSLSEIKEMMQSKGVRLGMALEGGDRTGRPTHDHRIEPPQEVPPEIQALLNKPISELSLSVRARKCMSKLNIQIGGRPGQAERRRAAGVQELRRHLAQRGPRQADHAGAEAEERLTWLVSMASRRAWHSARHTHEIRATPPESRSRSLEQFAQGHVA